MLAAQYYRPPFPDRTRWREDLRAMRDAGLDAVQLWLLWGWIEPEPDRLRFDDFDELVSLAAASGLGVVLCPIAFMQPFWIHRAVPGAHLVDHAGHRVHSVTHPGVHIGLTPGGCIDHPEVRRRIGAFLEACARRYESADHVVAWDCWNETRWAAGSQATVCYCPHTQGAFRRWLRDRYDDDLDVLNRAWRRRYCAWEDVEPGRLPARSYTEMLEFQAFLTARAREFAAFSYAAMRHGDSRGRPVFAHHAIPGISSIHYLPEGSEPALARGNDWELAEVLDGFGSSHFPAWRSWSTAAAYGAGLEAVRSAADTKPCFVSELQGGAIPYGLAASPPVPGAMQQRWVWEALGRGYDGVVLWSWRDEVFGPESGTCGVVGADGYADDRLRALRETTALLARLPELATYRPDRWRVGVLFEPAAYHLDWAQSGPAADLAQPGLEGYLYALERLQVPYGVIESRHLDRLAECRVLFMPCPWIVRPELGRRLRAWIEAGGTLLVESELDAFDTLGFYRYPGERPFAEALGVTSRGRRPLGESPLAVTIDGRRVDLEPSQWLEPFERRDGDVLCDTPEGVVALQRPLGAGRVVALGTYAGRAYRHKRARGFEELLRTVLQSAGAPPALRCTPADGELIRWRLGRSRDQRILWLVHDVGREPVQVADSGGVLSGVYSVRNLVTGITLGVVAEGGESCVRFSANADGYDVLAWPSNGR
jgi:beta-galactosidase